MSLPKEWQKNNAPALQALICGLNPDDFIKEQTEPCTMTEAAEICKVSIYVLRRYAFGRFPQLYEKLGITAMPPLDSSTQTFDKEELKKWAKKLDEVRAKAQALTPKRPKMAKDIAAENGWVRLSDLAQVARIQAATLWHWTRHGIPAKYASAGAFPTPTYKRENIAFYDKSALEWARNLGNLVSGLKKKEEEARRERMGKVAEENPLLVRRPVVASMAGVSLTAFSAWSANGIPKSLRELGCPEVPPTIYGSCNAAFIRAEEVSPWVLAYKKAAAKLQEVREEKQKKKVAKQVTRVKNGKPRSESAFFPDTSDLGFEVICEADAAFMLKLSKVTLNKIVNRGISRKMKMDGVPDFPAVACERKRYKLFKKSEVEAWGKTYRSIYPLD